MSQTEPHSPPSRHQADEDEIDLADLAAVLYRNRYLIFLGTLLVTLLAAGYTLLQSKLYEATTFLEIGRIQVDETAQNIEPPQAVKDRLRSSAFSIARSFTGEGPNQSLRFSLEGDLSVNTPEGGNIVRVALTAPKGSVALPFLTELNRSVIEAHNRILSQSAEKLRNEIKSHELAIERTKNQIGNKERQFEIEKVQTSNEIAQLKQKIDKELQHQLAETKRTFQIKEIQAQNQVSNIERGIQNLQDQKARLQKIIDLLAEARQDLEKRIQNVEELHGRLLESKISANGRATADSAISLMLFNNELMEVRRHLESLRDRAVFGIPNRKVELEGELQGLGTKIQTKKAELKEAQTRLKQVDAELQGELEAIRADIQARRAELKQKQTQLQELDIELKSIVDDLEADNEEHRLQIQALNSRLKNRIVTQVAAEPQYSASAVAPNLKLNVALGLVLGGFMSVFAAFLMEFWRHNRSRIVRQWEQGEK